MKKFLVLAFVPFLLAACSDGGGGYGMTEGMMSEESLGDVSYSDEATLTAAGPRYVIGTPYYVEKTQYVPMEDMTYNQTGVAGVIPEYENGKSTTNGEVFNSGAMVAASKVLPLPSVVKVTNLENGRSVLVRVNNRGPFLNSRIIDLSRSAASRIGMKDGGTAKVQVQIMPELSMRAKNNTLGIAAAPQQQYVQTQQPAYSGGGEYTVQIAAMSAEDSANAMANRLSHVGHARVIREGDLYKVRIQDLDAATARRTIDTLRNTEGMSPGLLKNGRWVNSDSI